MHPPCRACVPGPAAAPDVRRLAVNIGTNGIGLDLITMDRGAVAGVLNGIEKRQQLVDLVAFAQHGEGKHRPQRGMRVLSAILANARRVALDIAWITLGLVEGG